MDEDLQVFGSGIMIQRMITIIDTYSTTVFHLLERCIETSSILESYIPEPIENLQFVNL